MDCDRHTPTRVLVRRPLHLQKVLLPTRADLFSYSLNSIENATEIYDIYDIVQKCAIQK